MQMHSIAKALLVIITMSCVSFAGGSHKDTKINATHPASVTTTILKYVHTNEVHADADYRLIDVLNACRQMCETQCIARSTNAWFELNRCQKACNASHTTVLSSHPKNYSVSFEGRYDIWEEYKAACQMYYDRYTMPEFQLYEKEELVKEWREHNCQCKY